MPVEGPERQTILAVPPLGGSERAAAQVQAGSRTLVLRPPSAGPAEPPAVASPARNPVPRGLPDGRPAASFLAQLIGQGNEGDGGAADEAADRLRLRRQFAALGPGAADAEGRSRRGTAGQRQATAEDSAAAYRQSADTSRAYAVARYGAVRDVAGLYLADTGGLDITV